MEGSKLAPEPRILFLNFGAEPLPEDEVSVEDFRELSASGVEWRLIALKGSRFAEQVKGVKPNAVELWDEHPKNILDRKLKQTLDAEISAGFNLIHVLEVGLLGSVLPWVLRYPQVPVVLSQGSVLEKRISHWFQALFYKRIDLVLVPSRSIRDRVSLYRPVLESQTRTLFPGLDLSVFNPDHFDFKILRKKWGLSDDVYLVGMIASKDAPQAQSSFIKAAASFLRNEELSARTQFVIVGFESEGNDVLLRLIQEFHLEKQIRLVPAEDSVPLVLGTLDVFVLPSNKAVYGLQAIEALAIGTPIVCATGPDPIEWIGTSRAGYLIRSGDAFDLQRKLRLILEDPEELKAMGKRASEYARAHYGRSERTKRLISLYIKSLKSRLSDSSRTHSSAN
jgi:glycosyltransferase involved in cell wall biosynthesis